MSDKPCEHILGNYAMTEWICPHCHHDKIDRLTAEVERLQRTLRDHLDSEAYETMRADRAQLEVKRLTAALAEAQERLTRCLQPICGCHCHEVDHDALEHANELGAMLLMERDEAQRKYKALREAALAVIADHDERVGLYGERELQPHRELVMEALRGVLRPGCPAREVEK